MDRILGFIRRIMDKDMESKVGHLLSLFQGDDELIRKGWTDIEFASFLRFAQDLARLMFKQGAGEKVAYDRLLKMLKAGREK